ncbi:MAG: hypothetical protein M9962_10305 [Oligoflexia bacterium]|nr:hypothetical protein [Oligoflexia bacterium]
MIFLSLLLSLKIVFAADPLPYLGPGADKLSLQEYEKIYKNYIQTSILLGYPFLKEKKQACESALYTIFRQAGFFGYPVPSVAQQIQRSVSTIDKKRVESYWMGGIIIQLVRSSTTKEVERLVLVNSSSPKATSLLLQKVKKEILQLEKDPKTGLERVKGVPVGYPHPFLSADGQGIFVRILSLKGKGDSCEPIEFFDNSWVGGFDINNENCVQLQSDADQVWAGKLETKEFKERQLKRMKEIAKKNALDKGVKAEEADKLIEKHFIHPYTSEINVVGGAMRSLAQCNLLSFGLQPKNKASGSGDVNSPSQGEGTAGSAQ